MDRAFSAPMANGSFPGACMCLAAADRARGVGQASSLPVRAASCRPFPAGHAGRRNREHGAGMPREPAGKDACPTPAGRLNRYWGVAPGWYKSAPLALNKCAPPARRGSGRAVSLPLRAGQTAASASGNRYIGTENQFRTGADTGPGAVSAQRKPACCRPVSGEVFMRVLGR